MPALWCGVAELRAEVYAAVAPRWPPTFSAWKHELSVVAPGKPNFVAKENRPPLLPIYSGFLHRFLWEQNVAKNVKFCKLSSQLRHIRSLWDQKVAKKVENYSFRPEPLHLERKFANFRREESRRRKFMHAQHPTTPRLSNYHPPTHVLKIIRECDLSSSRIAPTKGFEQS